MKFTVRILAVVMALSIVGCGATAPVREVSLPPQVLAEATVDENTNSFIFYNGSNAALYGIDGSGRINLYLDGDSVGQLKINEYVILNLEPGLHRIKLVHKDLMEFTSYHEIDSKADNTFVKLYSKPISNGVDILDNVDMAKLNPLY